MILVWEDKVNLGVADFDLPSGKANIPLSKRVERFAEVTELGAEEGTGVGVGEGETGAV